MRIYDYGKWTFVEGYGRRPNDVLRYFHEYLEGWLTPQNAFDLCYGRYKLDYTAHFRHYNNGIGITTYIKIIDSANSIKPEISGK